MAVVSRAGKSMRGGGTTITIIRPRRVKCMAVMTFRVVVTRRTLWDSAVELANRQTATPLSADEGHLLTRRAGL